MIVCGEGEWVKTFLLPGQASKGYLMGIDHVIVRASSAGGR
jgi:hypothetical protein